jgi:hypothetical protein
MHELWWIGAQSGRALVKRTKNGGEEMLAETSTCRPGRLPFDPGADGGGS